MKRTFPAEIDAVAVERRPLPVDLAHEHGPFDIVGDVHGCREELEALLTCLGYVWGAGCAVAPPGAGRQGTVRAHERVWTHPRGRKAVFLGDLVDRGPETPGVLRLVMAMVEAGTALCVPGNHDVKLLRKLCGRDVQVAHGLAESLAQLELEGPAFRQQVAAFIGARVSHHLLDDRKLVVAHAGMKEALQGGESKRVRQFALYGETTGEMDEYGLPVRVDWARDYRGSATVVFGHTPLAEPQWLNGTLCIDTGCVFGGRLTALRYPEREIVSVKAARTYWVPKRPLPVPDAQAAVRTSQHGSDEAVDPRP